MKKTLASEHDKISDFPLTGKLETHFPGIPGWLDTLAGNIYSMRDVCVVIWPLLTVHPNNI